MPDDEIIRYRKQYVVDCDYAGNRTTHRFDDVIEANQSLLSHIGALSDSAYVDRVNEHGEFGGRLTWYVDEVVPLTYLDELLAEYGDSIHGGNTLEDMPVDRDHRYLLVEENVRGGYWLTSSDDAQALADNSSSQEYAHEWEMVGLFDLIERRELSVTITATVEVS